MPNTNTQSPSTQTTTHPNSFKAAATLESGAQKVSYFKLSALEGVDLARRTCRLGC